MKIKKSKIITLSILFLLLLTSISYVFNSDIIVHGKSKTTKAKDIYTFVDERYDEYIEVYSRSCPEWKIDSNTLGYYYGEICTINDDKKIKEYEEKISNLGEIIKSKDSMYVFLLGEFVEKDPSKEYLYNSLTYGNSSLRIITNTNGTIDIFVKYGENIKHSDENFEEVSELIFEKFAKLRYFSNELSLKIIFLEDTGTEKNVHTYDDYKEQTDKQLSEEIVNKK